MAISFVSHEYTHQLKNETELKNWLKSVAKGEKKTIGDINYIFTSDEFLLGLNKKYLKHNTYTDIITFDYSENGKLSGDIIISMDRVKENAIKFKTDFEEELYRVMVHGVLHLAGYTDKSPRKKLEMSKKEDESLKRLK